MNKSELRKIFLEKRSVIQPKELGHRSGLIGERFFNTFDLTAISTLHCFISIDRFNEIDTSYIYKRIWSEFPRMLTVVPRVDSSNGEMKHIAFNSKTELVKNKWEVPEPINGIEVEAAKIDLALVPLLAFDERGNRVGYGKGFYDKFLANCRADCLKVGLSLFLPVEKIDDISEHDIGLDVIVTPKAIFSTEKDADLVSL